MLRLSTQKETFKYYLKCRRADIFGKQAWSGRSYDWPLQIRRTERCSNEVRKTFFRRPLRLALQTQLSRGPGEPVNAIMNSSEAYSEKVGLFFWCRQIRRRRRMAGSPGRKGRGTRGDDPHRASRSRGVHHLHRDLRLLL